MGWKEILRDLKYINTSHDRLKEEIKDRAVDFQDAAKVEVLKNWVSNIKDSLDDKLSD